jgi:hypothetical protein
MIVLLVVVDVELGFWIRKSSFLKSYLDEVFSE